MITATPTLQQQQPVTLEALEQDQLLDYFRHSWAVYEWLFSSIKDEATFYKAPDPLRHPLIFYWGHTAAFYINKLVAIGLLEEGLDAHYEELFAKGVDPNLPEHLETHELWPSLAEVHVYRQRVKQTVEACILAQAYPITITASHPLWALLMAIEHDRIHFETSSVLIRQLPAHLLQRPQGWAYAPSQGLTPTNAFVTVLGGNVTLGRPASSNTYGWDNEYGKLTTTVAPFEVQKNLISNQEYLAFYNSGAYQQAQYWTEEGWTWKNRTQTQHPKFWVPQADGSFKYRAMFDELPMPLGYPVEVNAHEAWAYCKWKGEGYRLLSEVEFQYLIQQELQDRDSALCDDYNLHLKYGSPHAVGSLKTACSPQGINDLLGNVWDWLSDDFYALPGFEVHPLYKDFSAPYFDDAHSMLLGGCWATTGTGASRYYRLWFRRHFYQHAGFRMARDYDPRRVVVGTPVEES